MITREKTAFVTGGTGFLGYELIRQLLESGHRVFALSRNGTLPGVWGEGRQRRPESPNVQPDDLPRENLEIVQGDLGDLDDVATLAEAMREASVVYHVAANVQMWTKRWDESERANVVGTRNMVQAAQKAEVSRFVFTSSGSTIGKPHPPTEEIVTVDETSTYNFAPLNMVYPHTKWLAEQEVLYGAAKGLHTVITHPTAIFGPGDWKANVLPLFLATRTLTGLAVPNGIRNTCDVRDVATAHIVAAAKAPAGARYILSGDTLTVRELFTQIAQVMGGRPPRITLPDWAILGVARAMELGASLSGRPPKLAYEMALQSTFRARLSSQRAADELGYASRPVEMSIADMAKFYQEQNWI